MKISKSIQLLSPLLMLLGATQGLAMPKYTAAGELIAPLDYRDWIFLTSGVNMNYSDRPSGMGHDMVDNVFVDPASWRAFKTTGRWPNGTTFVKEARIGSSNGSIPSTRQSGAW